MPLNFNVVETPYFIYVTLRKSLIQNTTAFKKSESPDDKDDHIKMNQTLNAKLEEALLECEEK